MKMKGAQSITFGSDKIIQVNHLPQINVSQLIFHFNSFKEPFRTKKKFFFFFSESPLSPNFNNTEYWVSSITCLSIHVTCWIFFFHSLRTEPVLQPLGGNVASTELIWHQTDWAMKILTLAIIILNANHCFPFPFPRAPSFSLTNFFASLRK